MATKQVNLSQPRKKQPATPPLQHKKEFSQKFEWNPERFESIKSRLLTKERNHDSTLILMNELKASPADVQYYSKLLDSESSDSRRITAKFIKQAFITSNLAISDFLPAFREMLTRKVKVGAMSYDEARVYFGKDRFDLFLKSKLDNLELKRYDSSEKNDKKSYLVERARSGTINVYLVDYSRMVELTDAIGFMVQFKDNPHRQELVEFAEGIFRWWLKTNSVMLNSDDENQIIKHEKLITHLASGLDRAGANGAKLSDDINEKVMKMLWD